MKPAMPPRESLHALAGPYALNALDEAERDQFERHLRGCAACQGEIRGFAAVVAALPGPTAEMPPAGLRARVLAAVSATRQLSPGVTTSPEAPKVPVTPALRASCGERRSRGRRSSWLPRLALATGAAGLAASAVLGGVTVSARNGQSAAQVQTQAIAAVLAAPGARLVSAPTSAGGRATVVAAVRQGTMVFTSSGLRSLRGSRVYQLWFIGRTTRSAGLVPAAIGGRTAPVLASGLAAGDKIGVTVEPAGGSSAPTTAPIVVMTLPG